MALDLLLLHVPRLGAVYEPLGEFSFINLMPMGMFSLADYARRRGYKTKMLHYQVEEIADGGFSLKKFLSHNRPRVIGMSLSWHPQSASVIDTAKRIKKDFPETFIVLGGFTASAYSGEILETHPEIDAVIKGEGEEPLVALLDSMAAGKKDFKDVPNLAWRRGNDIISNPLTWHASTEDLSSYRFSDLSLLNHYRIYRSSIGLPPLWLKGASRSEMRKKTRRFTGIFCLELGRGCSVNCTWCGGGKDAQLKLAGRKKPVFTSPESALDSVKEALSFGYPTIYMSFDPYPKKPEFYLEFFRLLRKSKVRPDAYFESWSLPVPEFIEEFGATFKPGSLIGVSPESGSEAVRNFNKGMSYSNSSLFKTLDKMKKHGVLADITFSIGIPGEGPAELEETRKMAAVLKSHAAADHVMTMLISMEPFSPWNLDPGRYGVVHGKNNFESFREASGDPAKDPFSYLGYTYKGIAPGEFDRNIQNMRCAEFCQLPWMAPGLSCSRRCSGKEKNRR